MIQQHALALQSQGIVSQAIQSDAYIDGLLLSFSLHLTAIPPAAAAASPQSKAAFDRRFEQTWCVPIYLKSNGPFGNSQFGQKFGGLMRASLLNQLQVSTQKSN